MWDRRRSGEARWAAPVLAGVVMVAAVGMVAHTVGYVLHPDYSFWEAAQGIAAIINADGDADGGEQTDGGARPVLVSDSGDDLTLWTGVPAICERYTLHGLDAMLNRYKPGWYAAWPGAEDNSIREMGRRYRLDEVARYRVFDEPTRQTLVLYKLTPR